MPGSGLGWNMAVLLSLEALKDAASMPSILILVTTTKLRSGISIAVLTALSAGLRHRVILERAADLSSPAPRCCRQ
jgi:hypothetical protein